MNTLLFLTILISQPKIVDSVAAPSAVEEKTYFEHSEIILEAVAGDLPKGSEVDVSWNVINEELDMAELFIEKGRIRNKEYSNAHLLIGTGPVGRYPVFANIFTRLPDGNRSIRTINIWIKIVPRGPPPEPVPPQPEPGPEPEPKPFPAPGLAILIIHEASETNLLPSQQRAIFTSSDVLKFAQKCVDIPGGEDKFFRIWDDDFTDANFDRANSPEILRDAYREVLKQSNGRLPWIAISTDSGGYSGPLPETVDSTVELLRRYAP